MANALAEAEEEEEAEKAARRAARTAKTEAWPGTEAPLAEGAPVARVAAATVTAEELVAAAMAIA